MKMHDGEVDIDAGLVGRLVAAQFPGLGGLPVRAVQSTGTVNAIYRLGDHLYARLPRLPSWVPGEGVSVAAEARAAAVAAGPRAGGAGAPGGRVPPLLGDLPLDRWPAVCR